MVMEAKYIASRGLDFIIISECLSLVNKYTSLLKGNLRNKTPEFNHSADKPVYNVHKTSG